MKGGKSYRFICQHWSNLAHGSVVQMARKKYPKLRFGMPLIVTQGVPLTNSRDDIIATENFMHYQVDWNWSPITEGDYSTYMKSDPEWGPLLPKYTEEEKNIMRGTMDFVALNYYSGIYVRHDPSSPHGYSTTLERNGQLIGPVSGTEWQNIYTVGMRDIVRKMHDYYKMDIWITESGTSVAGEKDMTLQQVVNDEFRIDFFRGITKSLNDAVNVDKMPVKGFLGWALIDNFEWRVYFSNLDL
jgi:beta-glucosidase